MDGRFFFAARHPLTHSALLYSDFWLERESCVPSVDGFCWRFIFFGAFYSKGLLNSQRIDHMFPQPMASKNPHSGCHRSAGYWVSEMEHRGN